MHKPNELVIVRNLQKMKLDPKTISFNPIDKKK